MAKMTAIIPDDCGTVTVALPTAASAGFISVLLPCSRISTAYELPLTRFKKEQTNKHTDTNDHYTSLCATPTRGNNIILSECKMK